MMRQIMARSVLAGLLIVGSLAAACATHPVTGQRQIALYTEEQEIAMGRQAHEQIVHELGLYPDSELQRYVERIGSAMAQASERPHLPWTFAVLDDASVNAFALPGGFIYVTRGMLAHMGSEAELAGVLGHEIGHVTARHSIERLSRAQLATLGLGLGAILSPEVQRLGEVAELGLSLLFLSYSRSDEREADDLGLRYMAGRGYAPQAMAELFGMLDRVSRARDGGRLPNWLSTHPNPANRQGRMLAQAAELPTPPRTAWNTDAFMARIDGMVYGPDPRQGFFRDGTFHHPDLQLRIGGPHGWQGINRRQAVVWQSPRQDAVLVLSIAEQRSATAAAQQFFGQRGVELLRQLSLQPGFPSASGEFQARVGQTPVQGVASFVEHGGRVFRLVGYSAQRGWGRHGSEVARAIQSFQRETDPAVLRVQPLRLDVVSVPRAMDVQEVTRVYPTPVSPQELALVNNVDLATAFPAGTPVKRVVGDPAVAALLHQ
jgi:predicted Zn-dependent protease